MKNEKDRLEAMEMWIWRKMNKTSWVERKANEQVLKD
ncbi:putative transposon-derived protein F52C9.6, partial [Aphis craccivora]